MSTRFRALRMFAVAPALLQSGTSGWERNLQEVIAAFDAAWQWASAHAGVATEKAVHWASAPVDPRGSVFLLTGGLVTLAFLLPIALFRNRHQAPDQAAVAAVAPRSVETTVHTGGRKQQAAPAPPAPDDPEFDRGRRAGSRLASTVRTVDELLERLQEADFGEPRIVRSLPNLYVVGLYGCRGCSPSNPVGPSRRARGCTFECGVIEGAFAQMLDDDVVAREVACRARGHPYCEFEVWY